MLYVTLTSDQRDAVHALRRDPSLTSAERDRVEMVLLSAGGRTVLAIAAHLGYCAATIRRVFHQVRTDGTTALRRKRPGPPPDVARREQVEVALCTLLAQDRTWTAAQLADALGAMGIRLSQRHLRRYLRRMGARYRRTVRTLRHKQDPARVARAQRTLTALKKRPPQAS